MWPVKPYAVESTGGAEIQLTINSLGIVGTPLRVSCVVEFNFLRPAINAISIDDRASIGIAAALCRVILVQRKFEIYPRGFVGVEGDAIKRNAFVVNVIALQRFEKEVESGAFVQRMFCRSSLRGNNRHCRDRDDYCD